MAKKIGELKSFIGGIADSIKVGIPYSFGFGRAIDFRSNPSQITLNPKSERQAGSLVTDLPMWWDLACSNLYAYGNTGNIYKKDLSNSWSIEHSAPNSRGNGLAYFPEDSYLYYAQDKTIGRRSEACGTGEYYDGFLESEGGEPTNTKSITFVRSSSQYASIADNASLSITDDISMEAYVKFTTLPASTEVQTLISKWNENGNQRSYKFDLTTSSNAFGDGRDGALTISSNTTEDPIDANCTGTSGQNTLTITNAHASFASVASGDKVLIHQTRGTGAGTYQVATVSGYSGGVLTIQEYLSFSPAHSATTTDANKAQVRKLKQHTTVTVNSGVTYTVKAWDGLKGGILGFFANDVVTVTGTISANGSSCASQTDPGATGGGFRGATGVATRGATGKQGEGTAGLGTQSHAANGNGGGGGLVETGLNGASAEGGSGGNMTAGDSGRAWQNGGSGYSLGTTSDSGIGGSAVGVSDNSSMNLGGGGGSSSITFSSPNTSNGGSGGGIVYIIGKTITITGGITANGGQGYSYRNGAIGGDGGNGCILLKTQVGTLGSLLVSAINNRGGDGVNALYYLTSYTGSTTPALTAIQDSTLGDSVGYILRLLISSNGTNTETYTQNVTDIISTDQWYRWQVTWDAPTSTANFYQNGSLLGTKYGSLTQIYNSTARFALATSYDSSGTAHDFLDAKMDDCRVWNDVRLGAELALYNDRVLTGVDANLSAYYRFEDNVNDSQTWTFTSNLTATNTPTYSTDVPFAGITTRADQDININAVGSTYTLTTAINEGATHRQTFTPTKEPIKSIQLNINTVGTGNWTIVIHDGLNREIASMTVANAQLHTSYYEFVLPSSFRPILTANYHVHVYSTVADGKIVTSSLDDMEGTTGDTGAYLDTFYQILVDDQYHPMTQFLNFLVVGNERYVAKLEAGNIYNPHQLTLPAGYRVRCFAKWNEYLAIGVWKGDSITDTDQGKIFLWDGSSDTSGTSSPNTIVDVLEGGVNAMQGAAGVLSIIAGYRGKLLMYGGGQTQKMTQLPLLGSEEYGEIAPGAMAMWQSILRFGATLNTDSETVHKGVYSYGRLNANYPLSLGFDYPLSLGDQTSSSVKIGSIFPAGQSLYIGWQNGNTYGIDKITTTNDCYASGTIELLITDLGRMTQWKMPLVFRADFEPLTQGQSIVLKYKPDREASWRQLPGGNEDTVGATEVRGQINQNIKEVQLAADIYSTSGATPVVIQLTLEAEPQTESKGV